MEARLLVDSGEDGALAALVRGNGGRQVELEALCDLVVELDLRLEHVDGVPGVGEREPVLLVEQLGLDVTDDRAVRVAVPRDLEGDVRGRLGLDLERSGLEGVVLLQQIRRGLAEILDGGKWSEKRMQR